MVLYMRLARDDVYIYAIYSVRCEAFLRAGEREQKAKGQVELFREQPTIYIYLYSNTLLTFFSPLNSIIYFHFCTNIHIIHII